MAELALPDEIQIGSFFLETLTTGMYENPLHCLREYVQNGFDAINDAIEKALIGQDEGKVTVSITGTTTRQNITIRDNGAGQPAAEAVDRFISLGASHKRPQKHAGFRGIGRLAGIAYCTTLKFTTKAAGEADATVITFDCAKMRGLMAPGAEVRGVADLIKQCVTAETKATATNQHFTEVEMLGLVGAGVRFTDQNRLIPYLSQYAPVDYAASFPFAEQIRRYAEGLAHPLWVIDVELKVRKDKIRITKPYKKNYPLADDAVTGAAMSTLSDIKVMSSQEHGWFGWFGVSNFPGTIPDNSVAGIRFRQKNIQIGDAAIIESIAAMPRPKSPKGSDRTLQRWAVGEIFITNTAIVPNARRDGFEDNEAWRLVQADANAVTQSLVKLIRSSSKNRNLLKKARTKIAGERDRVKQPGFPEDDAVREAVDKELNAQLEAIEKAIKGGADGKEAAELISQIKELRESLAELAKKAREAKPQPEDDDSDGGDDNASDTGDDDEPDADGEPALLALVREILTERLGEDLASDIMDAVYDRLG